MRRLIRGLAWPRQQQQQGEKPADPPQAGAARKMAKADQEWAPSSGTSRPGPGAPDAARAKAGTWNMTKLRMNYAIAPQQPRAMPP
jgi:hypothetical protein